ncbi:MAG TPA: POTRA domain-containing protein, partial [Candidatus Acidoferrales bacterium]|nr:POTRA domain-containing protein [Candidatus Acidoferrales bacterium]
MLTSFAWPVLFLLSLGRSAMLRDGPFVFSMPHTDLLRDLIVLYGMAMAIACLMRRARQSTVVGYLLTGEVAGPFGLQADGAGQPLRTRGHPILPTGGVVRICLLARVAAALAISLCAWAAPGFDCDAAQPAERPASSAASGVPDGIIRRIEFAGLRRISAAALRAHIGSREGRPLDPAQVEDDVRALDRLGWFDSVTAEVHPMPVLLAAAQSDPGWSASLLPAGEILETGLRLVFVVEERPFLAAVEFRGSHVLSRERISAVLGRKQIALKVAAPASRTELWRARRAIEGALADLGHPSARVRLRLDEVPTAAVRATFEISDGPAISVSRVSFAGNHAFSERTLRRQMKRIAPGAHLAELRHKNTYTRERLTEDLERLENFYRNHGYPEARVGQPVAEIAADPVLQWSPFTMR